MTEKRTLKKIGFASFIMMASVFGSRIIGAFREIAIADVGGVQAGVDAYQVAFIIPEILNHIVATGFLSVTFIPIFTSYLVSGREKEGFKIFSIILNTFGLVLLFFIITAMVFAPAIVSVFAPGIKDPVTFKLAVKMTRIIIPAQFFFFCGGLFMAVQFAKEKFFIPAIAPLIYNFCIIAGGLILSPFIGMEGFAWGVLIGALLGNFALQIYGAKKAGVFYFPLVSLSHPDLKKYILLTLPLMVGLTMTFSVEILVKFFGSFLDTGNIAALNYCIRVMFILVGLFGQAVGVAAFPFMAKLAKKEDFSELNQVLNSTLKFIFLVIPISVFFMVLSHEIIQVLFERGNFTPQATALTAGILPYFMVGAFAFSAQNLVSRGYYATQNTLFPAIFTSLCVILTLPVIYYFMTFMGARGVALGLSITVTVQALVLFELWNKKSHNTGKKEVYLFFLKMIPVSLIIGCLLYVSANYLRELITISGFWASLALIFTTGIEFCLLFLLTGYILGINEIRLFYNKIARKIVHRSTTTTHKES